MIRFIWFLFLVCVLNSYNCTSPPTSKKCNCINEIELDETGGIFFHPPDKIPDTIRTKNNKDEAIEVIFYSCEGRSLVKTFDPTGKVKEISTYSDADQLSKKSITNTNLNSGKDSIEIITYYIGQKNK